MNWTKQDEAAIQAAWGRTMALRDVADVVVELLAARGGTMTAEELSSDLDIIQGNWPTTGFALREHIAAQGAEVATLREKVATLEGEVQQWMGQARTNGDERDALRAKVAELEADIAEVNAQAHNASRVHDEVRAELTEELRQWKDNADQWLRERDGALEAHAGAQRAAAAALEASRQHLLNLEAARKAQDVLERELARLKPSGQVAEDVDSLRAAVLSATRDSRDAKLREAWLSTLSRLATLAQQGQEMLARLREARDERDEFPVAVASDERKAGWHAAVAFISGDEEIGHHDLPPEAFTEAKGLDAPDALETASASVSDAMHPNGRCTCAGEGFCRWCGEQAIAEDAYDRGAEAMRAACWEVVQRKLHQHGLHNLVADFKAAIEGGTP